jgi:hypothetical protein
MADDGVSFYDEAVSYYAQVMSQRNETLFEYMPDSLTSGPVPAI